MITAGTTMHQLLTTAVDDAILAPSVHNTQPWTIELGETSLDIFADTSRQLAVLDPTGRQMYVSIGCAVLNARVSLAAAHLGIRVDLFGDDADPTHVARLVVDPSLPPDPALTELAPYVIRRQSNRRRFTSDEVPDDVLARIESAVRSEHVLLTAIDRIDDRLTLARLTQHADEQQIINPAYRAELRRWTTNDPARRDGVRAAVVPHVDGTARDEVPIRDFDSEGAGSLPSDTRSAASQSLFVLGTLADNPLSWVRAGQALERMWLELTAAGLVASLFTQPIEVPAVRNELRHRLQMDVQPHLVLRVGTAAPTASTRRRHRDEVLRAAGSR